jgi:hypothetical protein
MADLERKHKTAQFKLAEMHESVMQQVSNLNPNAVC